jgi:hypothetical protein
MYAKKLFTITIALAMLSNTQTAKANSNLYSGLVVGSAAVFVVTVGGFILYKLFQAHKNDKEFGTSSPLADEYQHQADMAKIASNKIKQGRIAAIEDWITTKMHATGNYLADFLKNNGLKKDDIQNFKIIKNAQSDSETMVLICSGEGCNDPRNLILHSKDQ